MRQFVVVGHDAPTDAEFPLDDLPSAAGRLDVLCRCVGSALFLSHGIREAVRVHLVLGDAFTVTFDADRARRINPDERSTAALVRNALAEREEAIGHVPVETSPGVSLRRRGVEPTVDALADEGTLVQLHEDGEPAAATDPPSDPVFVLSDHRDFTDAEADLLAEAADRRLRLGPHALHADQAITVAHHFLDTEGYERF